MSVLKNSSAKVLFSRKIERAPSLVLSYLPLSRASYSICGFFLNFKSYSIQLPFFRPLIAFLLTPSVFIFAVFFSKIFFDVWLCYFSGRLAQTFLSVPRAFSPSHAPRLSVEWPKLLSIKSFMLAELARPCSIANRIVQDRLTGSQCSM